AKHGVAESRPLAVSVLAKQTGNQDEYEAFFKLYSKYVHPSAWLVFARVDEADTPAFRNVFFIQAQYSGAKILKLIQDYSIASNQTLRSPSCDRFFEL